jgi:glycerol kinase
MEAFSGEGQRMPRDHVLVIDQGTTSTRAVVYDAQLRVVGQGQAEVLPTYPRSGWVEHDPDALCRSVGPQVTRALDESGVKAGRIAAIGLTNQRETTIVWDRATGRAIAPALVWQDRRTAADCDRLKDKQAWVRERTGLVIDPYFSATKIAWILDNIPDARRRAETGELAAGTVDCFLVWHLTGGRRFVTDVTNASRTLLVDIKTIGWADDLCEVFGVPPRLLPEILPSAGDFGRTEGLHFLPDGLPITGIAGDQQASLIGQGCLEAGQAKCTYGTGAFLLVHTGSRAMASRNGLITTLAAMPELQTPRYALEGSVFIAGAAVQWFRDGLKAIGASYEINPLSLQSDPDMDLIFVPALTGLGAPYWQPAARGTIFGINRATSVGDLARATLEGVAFQVADLIDAMKEDLNAPVSDIRVDGGMARSDPFLQFQADLLGVPIHRSPQTESTALGAAMLAGLGAGLWSEPAEATKLLQSGGQTFTPARSDLWRKQAHERWRHAVQTVIGHYSGSKISTNS